MIFNFFEFLKINLVTKMTLTDISKKYEANKIIIFIF
jgi:hypothetical protein